MKCGVVVLACVLSLISGSAYSKSSDDILLVEHLLRIKNPNLYENGEYNELKEVRRWENYIINRKRMAKSSSASAKDLKLFLAVGWSAELNNAAMTMGYMAAETYPIYVKHSHEIAKILGELPFMISATCRYLGAYFHFERDIPDFEGKNAFKKDLVQQLSDFLSDEQMDTCIQAYGAAE